MSHAYLSIGSAPEEHETDFVKELFTSGTPSSALTARTSRGQFAQLDSSWQVIAASPPLAHHSKTRRDLDRYSARKSSSFRHVRTARRYPNSVLHVD